ncbi:HAMP domain-containing sensor histidine kinase [Streptomyces sp. SL13]|uniref:histidine kinase n=1 Tax=Streptantibioticus silvisoli TaxID=2705255 RepID=A0AA90JYG5_9ACTN|nr:HAMP domain-containing sensor histidine kinase [Streptantibioticus silvisoli]MDI5971246.1 HAMP domain-containing sensor histidine kinase [Streptantibioticus silvisoli]
MTGTGTLLLRRLRTTAARLRKTAPLRNAAWLRRAARALRPSALSLRSRLVLLSVALVVIGLGVSDTVVLGSVQGKLVERADQQLERFGQPLTHRLMLGGPPPQHQQHGAADGTAGGGFPRSWLPSQYVVAFAAPDGTITQQLRVPVSAGDPRPLWPVMNAAQLKARTGTPFDVPSDHGGGSWRVLILPVGGPPGRHTGPHPGDYGTAAATTAPAAELPAGVVVAVSLDDVTSTTAKLRTAFLLIGLLVAALLGLAGWFAVRAGLRPLRRIEATATEIAAGRPLSYRMPDVSPRTEAGRLSTALNGMLAQIESAFAARAESEDRMRRFVADASHELRTPLAGIRGFAELYRMGALPDEADVQRTMARIESEAIRMGGLVQDLLTLARADEHRPLRLEPMDLRTLAADALHDTTALDATRPVSLTGPGGAGTPPGPALVLGDEARLRQVVANLVGNAVAHTPPGTPVRIGVGTAGGHGVIEVADSGPGLEPAQAARVFERFYRVDASRSRREGGGAGLGLAIVAALVTGHGGHVDLETAPGGGAVFRVSVPCVQPGS